MTLAATLYMIYVRSVVGKCATLGQNDKSVVEEVDVLTSKAFVLCIPDQQHPVPTRHSFILSATRVFKALTSGREHYLQHHGRE